MLAAFTALPRADPEQVMTEDAIGREMPAFPSGNPRCHTPMDRLLAYHCLPGAERRLGKARKHRRNRMLVGRTGTGG